MPVNKIKDRVPLLSSEKGITLYHRWLGTTQRLYIEGSYLQTLPIKAADESLHFGLIPVITFNLDPKRLRGIESTSNI